MEETLVAITAQVKFPYLSPFGRVLRCAFTSLRTIQNFKYSTIIEYFKLRDAEIDAGSPVRTKLPTWVPWYGTMNPLRWGTISSVPRERIPSPEHNAGFLSKLCFQWINPLMVTGYKRSLEQNDIWTVNSDRAVEHLTHKVKERFRRHVRRQQKHPLFWAFYEAFRFKFWLGGACSLCGTILRVLAPFTLRFLIQFVADAYTANSKDKPVPHLNQGIGFAVMITIMLVLQSFCMSHFIYCGAMIGAQSKGVLIDMIYDKAMIISNRAKVDNTRSTMISKRQDEQATNDDIGGKYSEKDEGDKSAKGFVGWDNGRITNLMSVDAHRIDKAAGMFHAVWTAPFACLMTLIVLLFNLTLGALPGFGLLVIGVPLLAWATSMLTQRRKKINKITDQRISLIQEILQSVRLIKLLGWERPYMSRLTELRSREMDALGTLLIARNTIHAISVSLPTFAAMLSFITFSLSDHELTPARVFSALALFNALKVPLSQLPIAVGQVADASLSLKRIEEFLLHEELEDDTIEQSCDGMALELHNASFTWESTFIQSFNRKPSLVRKKKKHTKSFEFEEDVSLFEHSEHNDSTLSPKPPFQLHKLNLKLERGELIAVIGTVGSGKSSLLAALAGDMRKTSGKVIMGGSRAFCSELPWIQNSTVEKNIIFGKPMDREWYDEVIKVCALQQDFNMLPSGDQTLIGERGINVSGGQKQRINMARAIYAKADIVLLDDPLSAVDARVGRHVFDHAILGYLKNRCRILVTHQLWVLSRCDRIAWMGDNGTIRLIDTFDNLMRDHQDFRDLMRTSAFNKDKAVVEHQPEFKTDVSQPKKRENAGAMRRDEGNETTISWSTYAAYFRASGSIFNALIVLFVVFLYQGISVMIRVWISFWTSQQLDLSKGRYIAVYAGLGALQGITICLFSIILSVLGSRASRSLHFHAIARVLRAPISFFDTTPLGRITNRFSRDIEVIDNNLSGSSRLYLNSLAVIVSAFITVIVYFPYFALSFALFPVLFAVMAYYRASARQIRRLEFIWRSQISAKFSEGLDGVVYIRAYGLKQQFINEMRAAINNMNSAYYLTFASQRWAALRLDMTANAFVLGVSILVVAFRFDSNPSLSGLVLSYVLTIVQLLQLTTRQLAAVEGGMSAVGRLRQYATNVQEEEPEAEGPFRIRRLREKWPEKGEIVFNKVQMRYRKNLPLVLKDVSLRIRGGERIGVVGRTGAGKSSIINTLFRLVELSDGNIIIDGINIATMSLHDLRSRLAIIPQDPTLFSGTVRSNLDPFNEKTDWELWSALQQANLTPTETSYDTSSLQLDDVIQQGGLNLSLGQRQLMALARALARGSQIIVCDEATSSVDMETDNRIQRTMATAFSGKTLICVAHRLRSILGYDRICVLDAGCIVELDTPLALWQRDDGVFRDMCDRSGISFEEIKN